MCIRNYLTLLFVIFGYVFTFTNSEYRMVGGSNGNAERTKYVVLIRYMDVNRCVGSLVTLEKVVTAADCVVDKEKQFFRVAAGVTNLHDKWENGQVHKVQFFVHPPGYNSETKHLNIAVMTLEGFVKEDPTIETIDLCGYGPWRGEIKMLVRPFGWEHTENDEISNPIQLTDWTSLRRVECEKCYRSPLIPLTPEMICARPATDGGYLVDKGTPGVVLGMFFAVASHYLNQADSNSPVVFTYVFDDEVRKFLYPAVNW